MRLLAWLLSLFAVLPLAAAERVVSLSPSMTDMLLELDAGDRLVGMLDSYERPPALVSVPSIGRYGQIDMERLLSLQPDLLLLWPGSVPPAQLDMLKKFGIPLYIAEPHRMQDVSRQLADLGERLGQGEKGRQLAQDFDRRVAQLRSEYRRERPLRVFYQLGERPLYTLGGNQVISDALQVCGATNLFADLDLPAPQVGMESVLARDPEVILAGSNTDLTAWRDMPQLSATRLGQLWQIPDLNLERPSYAMLAATEKLCRLLATAKR
ncbi:helical backbone metal receptor [Pseudomonas schmalbachii]|uniref:ABC transporter substrate-binding protein n=1 Tax=Pseudomonas schmalbachii TaxID=2816993 RepID=A0ABS3TRP1_9PSED|nr:helical backbone metal receptor [Pseudomonas schmalbachii]MBO3275249.1 ABC transporter substrate-binding protein [Pseudomonas schmalbachii]